MPTDKEDKIPLPDTSRRELIYTLNSYEETRSACNKSISSPDPTDYIQKVRVTRSVPPKPAYDPLQFVQLKPCNLVKSAQEQLKKAETVKKFKEEKKEEPEEWQCNLDNWKSSRRKRVEHIIDRVVEVKKLELEEQDRTRRKSKTFNEMMEERGSRRLKPLPIYVDNDDNDLSDLGIGKSEVTDMQEMTNNSDPSTQQSYNTQPSSNVDPNEYTYEDAIEDYKSRVSRAGHILSDNYCRSDCEWIQKPAMNPEHCVAYSSEEMPETNGNDVKTVVGPQLEIPKIDFLKRKELFEKEQKTLSKECEIKRETAELFNTVSIKERLSVLQLNQSQEISDNDKNQRKLADVSFSDLKNRLEVFEREIRNLANERDDIHGQSTRSSTSPEPCLQSYTSTLEPETDRNMNIHNTFVCKDIAPLVEKQNDREIYSHKPCEPNVYNITLSQKQTLEYDDNENIDTDREDSGIHTTDVSCSVSQADDQIDEPEQVEALVQPPISEYPHSDEDSKKYSFLKNEHTNETVLTIPADGEETNDVDILDDVLEMAFQKIDNMESNSSRQICTQNQEPIYQNVTDIEDVSPRESKLNHIDVEPYYQVPKSQEPYYEVPKTKPIPLYENIDMLQSVPFIADNDSTSEGMKYTISLNKLQPPKEKPPPPPTEKTQECEESCECKDNFKRINSTKRIKKEIRNKRSSFLGIDSSAEDDGSLEFSVAPPSRVACKTQEEKTFEKQFLMKSGLLDNSDTAESRDSGLSENHSRQSSDLFTASSDDKEELIRPKLSEQNIFTFNECGEHSFSHITPLDSTQQLISEESSHPSPSSRAYDQEAFSHISPYGDYIYDNDSTKDSSISIPPPIPPAKPLRSQQYLHQYTPYNEHRKSLSNVSNLEYGQLRNNAMSLSENQIAYHNAFNNAVALPGEYLPTQVGDQMRFSNNQPHLVNNVCEGISKTNVVNDWTQFRSTYENNDSDTYLHHKNMLRQRSYTECSPQWNIRSSRPTSQSNDSYSRLWFVQEAEQRRIEQQASIHHSSGVQNNRSSNRKSLPESVIQTITQRVQDLGIGTERRWQPENQSSTRLSSSSESGIKHNAMHTQSSQHHPENDDKVLSVSGKKKCSHCSNELGRGAAMVIESLGLLYHIDCFKCCVCHTRLGDGFKGTDVRVRKYKLHCQNCFSSEDGVKFSCV